MGLLCAWRMATTATLTAKDPRHYAWWFPGSPIRVHIDLGVIEDLQKRLRNASRAIPEQGLLFGKVLEGTTEILEFLPASGRTMPAMLEEFSAGPQKRLLVGYYRSGDALRLNADDLDLFKNFFGKPYHVFLVMQPNGFASPNATFFFSQGNQKISEFPFLEFPLDASLLATEERDRISRCRQATEQPATVQPPPPEPAKPRKPARISLRIAVGLFVTAGLLLPALWFANQPFRKWSSRVWTGISSAARNSPTSPASSSLPHPRIGLQAKSQGHDLELTWNRESALIAAATSGLISIEDGLVKREIPLDAQQIRGESVLYSPISDQVLIQLTVTGPAGTVTESVRVIRAEEISTYSVTSSKPPESVPPSQVTRPTKPFTAPPAAKQTSTPLPLNDPPAIARSPEHSAYPDSIAGPQTVAPPRPVPAPIPAQSAAAPAYYPPVATRQVAPTFPEELRAVSLKPAKVSIRVFIDKTGKVVKAEPLPQQTVHKLFIQEAVHAAERWRFQPARRGSEPVASESILRFSFAQ